MKQSILASLMVLVLYSCKQSRAEIQQSESEVSTYWSFDGRDDQFTGGIKMIPVTTPKGTFKVWTKRMGNNASKKVLFLHGGPGMTHE